MTFRTLVVNTLPDGLKDYFGTSEIGPHKCLILESVSTKYHLFVLFLRIHHDTYTVLNKLKFGPLKVNWGRGDPKCFV